MVQKGVIRVKKWLFSFGPRIMFLRSASQKNAFLSHFDTVLSHFCPHFDVKMPQKAPFWPQRTLKTTQKGPSGWKTRLFSFEPGRLFLGSLSQKNAFLSHFDALLSHFCPHFDVKMPQKAPFWPQRTLKTTQKGAFWVKNSTFFFWAWKAVFKVP